MPGFYQSAVADGKQSVDRFLWSRLGYKSRSAMFLSNEKRGGLSRAEARLQGGSPDPTALSSASDPLSTIS
jgi:hypothetical protein